MYHYNRLKYYCRNQASGTPIEINSNSWRTKVLRRKEENFKKYTDTDEQRETVCTSSTYEGTTFSWDSGNDWHKRDHFSVFPIHETFYNFFFPHWPNMKNKKLWVLSSKTLAAHTVEIKCFQCIRPWSRWRAFRKIFQA